MNDDLNKAMDDIKNEEDGEDVFTPTKLKEMLQSVRKIEGQKEINQLACEIAVGLSANPEADLTIEQTVDYAYNLAEALAKEGIKRLENLK